MTYTRFVVPFIGLIAMLTSCGKETQSTTEGAGKLYIKLSSVPANNTEAIGIPSLFSAGTSVKYYLPTKLNDGKVETDTFSVTKGQNFPIWVFGGNNISCSNILVEVYLDGKIYKSKSFNVGGESTFGVLPGAPKTCKYSYTNVSNGTSGIPYNLIIE